jgi:hypothetical protein
MRFVFWLAPGIVTFTLALAGCQKKEEPVPARNPCTGRRAYGQCTLGRWRSNPRATGS